MAFYPCHTAGRTGLGNKLSLAIHSFVLLGGFNRMKPVTTYVFTENVPNIMLFVIFQTGDANVSTREQLSRFDL